MKKKILLFLGCMALIGVMVLNVQLVKSDFSIGSNLSLNRILKISSAQAEDIEDSTKTHALVYNMDLQQWFCQGVGTAC